MEDLDDLRLEFEGWYFGYFGHPMLGEIYWNNEQSAYWVNFPEFHPDVEAVNDLFQSYKAGNQ